MSDRHSLDPAPDDRLPSVPGRFSRPGNVTEMNYICPMGISEAPTGRPWEAASTQAPSRIQARAESLCGDPRTTSDVQLPAVYRVLSDNTPNKMPRSIPGDRSNPVWPPALLSHRGLCDKGDASKVST